MSFTFIWVVSIVFFFFWLLNISRRLTKLEGKISKPSAFSSQPSIEPSVLVPTPPIPSVPITPSPALEHSKQTGHAINWLTAIGVLAVTLGVGFFLKYAIDQGWVSIWGRIIIGLVVGVLFLVLGELWHKKYEKYSQALSGGGLAILYFTVFAAYEFYGLVSYPIAFIVAVVIAGVGIWLSHRYESVIIAVLSIIGGYLAPVMFTSETMGVRAVYVYLVILNIVLFATLLKKYWASLLYLSLLGTAIIYGLVNNPGDTFVISLVFLLMVFTIQLLGTSLLYRQALSTSVTDKRSVNLAAIFFGISGTYFFLVIYDLLQSTHHDWLWVVSLIMSAIAFVVYQYVVQLDERKVNNITSFLTSAYLLAALLWFFDGNVQNIVLILVGTSLASVAFLFGRKEMRIWSLAMLHLGIIFSIFAQYKANSPIFFNVNFGLLAAGVLALVFLTWLYRNDESADDFEHGLPEMLRISYSVLLGFAVSVELYRYFDGIAAINVRNLSLSLWWVIYAVFLLFLSNILRDFTLRKVGIIVLGLGIIKVFLYDVQTLDTVYKTISFITLGVILLSVSYAYNRKKELILSFWEGDKEITPGNPDKTIKP